MTRRASKAVKVRQIQTNKVPILRACRQLRRCSPCLLQSRRDLLHGHNRRCLVCRSLELLLNGRFVIRRSAFFLVCKASRAFVWCVHGQHCLCVVVGKSGKSSLYRSMKNATLREMLVKGHFRCLILGRIKQLVCTCRWDHVSRGTLL